MLINVKKQEDYFLFYATNLKKRSKICLECHGWELQSKPANKMSKMQGI